MENLSLFIEVYEFITEENKNEKLESSFLDKFSNFLLKKTTYSEEIDPYVELFKKSYINLNKDQIDNIKKINEKWKKLKTLNEPLTLNQIKEISSVAGGRWYKCVNGHFCSIGQCERPMEEISCPTCGVMIGGKNHKLNRNNFEVNISKFI